MSSPSDAVVVNIEESTSGEAAEVKPTPAPETAQDPTMAKGKVVNINCTPVAYNEEGYQKFSDFYPYYLGEHHNIVNRRLHVISTTNSIGILALTAATGFYPLALLAVGQGYGLAWIGHFFFEKNKPATFSHPVYSFMGDFKLWFEVMTRKRPF